MVYKFFNNEAPKYLECLLLRQDAESEKRTNQDYGITGIRTPSVEKLTHKCKSFTYAVLVVCSRLP